jgi:molybdopterin synthase catalytic subunit
MARNQKQNRPVSEEEYEEMPKRIKEAFDRIREHMADELGGDPEDYEPDDLDHQSES